MLENLDKNKILEMIDNVVNKTFSMDYNWDWSAGVAFYGVARAWEVTGNQKYIDVTIEWVDKMEKIGIPKFSVNSIAMGHVLLSLYSITNDNKYLNLVEAKAEYLSTEAVRFGEGVFQHTVSQNYNFPEQAWADTLFMAALFLLRVGKLLDNKVYIKDALNQFYWHIEYLQDKKTGLFYHAWDNISKNNLSSVCWARANGWAAITIAEAIKLTDAFEPLHMELNDALRDQLAAVVRLQAEDGMWHTVINDKDSYTETSASCALGTALMIFCKNKGYMLYKEPVDKLLNGVYSNIDDTGGVLGVSSGTAVMKDVEGYRNIPNKRIQGWGQGLCLALLSEIISGN